MIIVDVSNVAMSVSMSHFLREKEQLTEAQLRRSFLYTFKKITQEYAKYMGSHGLVLAFDSKHYWRTDVFPLYKKNRKKMKEESKFDFGLFYEHLNTLKAEFKDELPYRAVEVYGTEADDVICVLSLAVSVDEPVLIYSADKDFLQLQEKRTNHPIKQYSKRDRAFITFDDRELTALEHVIGGDSSDGIPNIWSDDDVFMPNDKKSKPFTKKMKQTLASLGWDNVHHIFKNEVEMQRYKRNCELILFENIPKEYRRAVVEEYQTQREKTIPPILNYAMKHRVMDILG